MSARGKRVVKTDLMPILSIAWKTHGGYMCVMHGKEKSWSPWVTPHSLEDKRCEKARISVIFYFRNCLFLALPHINQLAIAGYKPVQDKESLGHKSSCQLLRRQMEGILMGEKCLGSPWLRFSYFGSLFYFLFSLYVIHIRVQEGACLPVFSLNHCSCQRQNHKYKIQEPLLLFYQSQWNSTENADIAMATTFPLNF